MAQIEIQEPKILVLEYRQEKSDEDYGTCLWARFYLDLINYAMMIESDCGNYSYSWLPTPDKESFLKLCSRFNKEYLIEKLSSRSVVDNQSTWTNIEELIQECTEYSIEKADYDLDEIKEACHSAKNKESVLDAIRTAIRFTNLENCVEDYDIWDCIKTDYPAGAKKIVDIYTTHIIPAIKERLKSNDAIYCC